MRGVPLSGLLVTTRIGKRVSAGRSVVFSEATETYMSQKKKERRCGQCGRTFRAKPCGFAHAEIGRWQPVSFKRKAKP